MMLSAVAGNLSRLLLPCSIAKRCQAPPSSAKQMTFLGLSAVEELHDLFGGNTMRRPPAHSCTQE